MTISRKNITCLFFLIFSSGLSGQTLNIQIKNINKTQGDICVAIFANETEFRAENPSHEFKYDTKEFSGNEYVVKIPFQSGCFGISILHDENSNGKMDYNILGIPREGFGFSDFFHKGIKKPHFDDFDFYIEKNENKFIVVVMKYF